MAPPESAGLFLSSKGLSAAKTMPELELLVKPLIDNPGKPTACSTPGCFIMISPMRRITSSVRSRLAPSGSCAKPIRYCLSGFALVASALSEGGGPRVLFITGDPGSGKSRFLETALERAALGGALVARLRPLESDSDAPWSALRALLREGGGGLLNLPGVAAAAPEAFGVVGHPAEDHGQVAAAFASLLRAACDEQQVAIGVDAAHYADGATLAALGAAVARLGTAPLLLVVAALEALDQAPRELWRLRAEDRKSTRL